METTADFKERLKALAPKPPRDAAERPCVRSPQDAGYYPKPKPVAPQRDCTAAIEAALPPLPKGERPLAAVRVELLPQGQLRVFHGEDETLCLIARGVGKDYWEGILWPVLQGSE